MEEKQKRKEDTTNFGLILKVEKLTSYSISICNFFQIIVSIILGDLRGKVIKVEIVLIQEFINVHDRKLGS